MIYCLLFIYFHRLSLVPEVEEYRPRIGKSCLRAFVLTSKSYLGICKVTGFLQVTFLFYFLFFFSFFTSPKDN
jgi:hypothetical protein